MKSRGAGIRSGVRMLALAALAAVPPVRAAAQIAPQEAFDLERGDVRLVSDSTSYVPGSTSRIAVVLTIEEGWHTNSHEPSLVDLIATEVSLVVPAGWPDAPELAYPPGAMKTFGFADQPLSVYEGEVVMIGEVAIPTRVEPGTYPLRASVTYQACDDRMCLAPVTAEETLGVTIGAAGAAGGEPVEAALFARGPVQTGGATGTASGPTRGFAWFILLALLGGLILNAMPCVLPVLSLKVLGLVKSADRGRRATVEGSLATAAGIVLSFLLLATAAVAARSAGIAVGWGIQFQEPAFVAALTVVVLLFTLNLWGLFEIPLPWWFGRLGSAGPSEGVAGHLTTGFFATLMATPCSAPFLGTALGFALTQSTATTYAMFGSMGIGMASPYLVLAALPGTARLVPSPGPWMRTFRILMGFLLAATAVWLLYVLSGLISPGRLAFFELALLAVAAAVWLGTRAEGRPVARRASMAAAILLCGAGVVWAAAGSADSATPLGAGVAPGDRLIAWEPFDRARAEREAAGGRHVFVDVTADWCLTCKVNERLFLETEEVARAFERHDVLALRADWTRRDEAIGEYLASFGRYGIPFYVLYRPGGEPYVFSELLSKSAITDLLGE